MAYQPPSFDEIKRNLASSDQSKRGGAMFDLLSLARRDSSIHREALPLFRTGLSAPDYYTVGNAARGIELIEGADAGRKAWLMLLNHPIPSVIGQVAMSLTDPVYVGPLLRVLERHDEVGLQVAVVRALGRFKDPRGLKAIVARLSANDPALRGHAADALGDLEDVRAVPYLEMLLKDRADAWPIDNHGPMLRVCDLATHAIARLKGTTRPVF